mmetsp:Transcript_17269/g.36489  ORF Transcript_17269/g.36489 Transcript_17269/m.36489 type:complete len:209 (+) Transcript_17269:779-1405(+)
MRAVIAHPQREEQEGINSEPLVTFVDELTSIRNRNNKILNDVLIHRLPADLSVRQKLDYFNLRCPHPPKQVSIDWVVRKRNHVTQFPKNRARKAVKVMLRRDEFVVPLQLAAKKGLHPNIIPSFPKGIDRINLRAILCRYGICQASALNNRGVTGEYSALEIFRSTLRIRQLLHLRNIRVFGIAADIFNVHERLDTNNFELHGNQESQ